MAAPTLIAFAEKDSGSGTHANGTGETTATLTWQAGDLLVAVAISEGLSAGNTFNAPTNTGAGLGTWTQQQLHAANGDCELGIWTNVATASGSGTVTITVNCGGTLVVEQVGVYQFRAPAAGSIAVGASGLATGLTVSPETKTITMTSVDSAVVWVAGDWSAGTAETPSPTATAHGASTPGPSVSPLTGTPSGHNTWYFDELDDETSTGSVAFGYTGTSAGPFTIGVVEIVTRAPSFVPSRMPLGA